jgi:ATP-dependent 26S proteasome regulatory subunit
MLLSGEPGTGKTLTAESGMLSLKNVLSPTDTSLV